MATTYLIENFFCKLKEFRQNCNALREDRHELQRDIPSVNGNRYPMNVHTP